MKNSMASYSKALTTLLVIPLIIVTLGQLSTASSQTPSVPEKALAYIRNVLPIDMERYTIMNVSYYELPEPLNTTYRTEAVTCLLNSSESLLVANCMFRNGVQYTCDLRVDSGTTISDKAYTSVVDIAISILEKHEKQTGVDSTELLNMLSMLDPTKDLETVTLNNANLTASHGKLPVGNLQMINGSPHIFPTTMLDITSFRWTRLFNGTEDIFLLIDFENGVFHSLRDERPISIDERPISGDKNLISETENKTENFPMVTAATASATTIAAGLCLAVYIKKRHHNTGSSINCDSTVAYANTF